VRHPGALFISLWAAATAIGWLLAHPIVQLFALQHIHVWGSAVIAIAVVATLLFSAARRKRNVDPRWLNIPINAGWALVAVVAFALGQPGSIAGVLQSLVLWPHFAASRRWMLASAVGAYFAFLLLSVVVLGNALLIYATAGFVIGVAQWLVLWKRVPRAGWWIAASALGYVAGGVAALAAGAGLNAAVGQLSPTVANAIGHTAPNLLGGVFYGAITGFWLARLLRARQSER
jgi:hypothetical protein